MAMNTHPDYQLGLERRGLFEIPDVAGVQIRCTEGSLWITLDHDLRDIVLAPGDVFTGSEHRRALVYALQPSSLAVRAPCAAPRGVRTARLAFSPLAAAT
jgi:hypothetical protein